MWWARSVLRKRPRLKLVEPEFAEEASRQAVD
jgi:hypothetical protein